MCNIPPETHWECPQTIWKELKSDIACLAKKLYKDETFKMMSKVKNLEKDIKQNTTYLETNNDKKVREEIAFLTNEVNHLQKKLVNDQRDVTCAQIDHHGVKPGRIWSAMNPPRDLIPQMKIPDLDPPQYERSTKRMAELAKTYHENLQTIKIADETSTDWDTRIEQALEVVPINQTITTNTDQ